MGEAIPSCVWNLGFFFCFFLRTIGGRKTFREDREGFRIYSFQMARFLTQAKDTGGVARSELYGGRLHEESYEGS